MTALQRRLKHLLGSRLASTLLVLAVACGGDGSDASEDTSDVIDTSVLLLPDTTGSSVWDYLVAERYPQTWWTWPGRGELYPGADPHGMLLTTYLNFFAHDALVAGESALPPGSILVKENYAADSTLVAVTVMYKSTGYDPARNDWFWARYGPTGEVETSGRAEDCLACHSQSTTDFVLTEPLGARPAGGEND